MSSAQPAAVRTIAINHSGPQRAATARRRSDSGHGPTDDRAPPPRDQDADRAWDLPPTPRPSPTGLGLGQGLAQLLGARFRESRSQHVPEAAQTRGHGSAGLSSAPEHVFRVERKRGAVRYAKYRLPGWEEIQPGEMILSGPPAHAMVLRAREQSTQSYD